eukprot:CAMPEP_0174821176 /NCGR_PEP_ID=MMETSP1107-20130205/5880_1 /TAXON_ID=36770 /ORGANISM="Paraphysomonas vestita, Strain GFlagA" /LENGTH=337 /DNA_ID=CAMNT_0016037923 /DNA_START=198 /DNA_END=1211 /DNA_ORIENTATION=+
MLSGDCSDRICPFDLAWVDKPDSNGVFHRYAECSGKGLCDRKSGLCECFDGYEGKACQRTSCPNDCSGHGTCEYIEDIAFGTVFNQYQKYDLDVYPQVLNYYDWDLHKTRGCVCDAQYTDIDCSKRMCPHGTDVLDLDDDHYLVPGDVNQIQTIILVEDPDLYHTRNIPASQQIDVSAQTFALSFKSRVNETYFTIPIRYDVTTAAARTDFSNDIRLALLGLPNQIIDDVSVSTAYDSVNYKTTITIQFSGPGVQGVQNLLSVESIECSDGCTPKITGLALESAAVLSSRSSIEETTTSEFNSYECGRRGKCDYTTGLCQCFEGYTGENCNEQTTLV